MTSVEQLRRVMEPVRQEIKCSICLDVLDEIFHRQVEEQYLSGRIGTLPLRRKEKEER